MSASVWFEEVNSGLLQELQNTVRIKNAKGTLRELPEPDKAFVVRKPEEDFKFEVFPCCSIYAKSYDHDVLRYHGQRVVVARDVENKVTTLEDPAVPFDLDYQIEFWAKYQEDMDDMTRTWLMRHFRAFNLAVTDDGGTPRTVNVMAVGNVVKSDLVQNKERLFRTIFNYRIWVEIDDEMQYNHPMVINRNLTVIPEY